MLPIYIAIYRVADDSQSLMHDQDTFLILELLGSFNRRETKTSKNQVPCFVKHQSYLCASPASPSVLQLELYCIYNLIKERYRVYKKRNTHIPAEMSGLWAIDTNRYIIYTVHFVPITIKCRSYTVSRALLVKGQLYRQFYKWLCKEFPPSYSISRFVNWNEINIVYWWDCITLKGELA